MIPFAYRITLQLDRARDNDAGFDDPIEVWTDEVRLALASPSEFDAAPADERGGEIMVEIRDAIAAILTRHGIAPRPSTVRVESSSPLPAIAVEPPAACPPRSVVGEYGRATEREDA